MLKAMEILREGEIQVMTDDGIEKRRGGMIFGPLNNEICIEDRRWEWVSRSNSAICTDLNYPENHKSQNTITVGS